MAYFNKALNEYKVDYADNTSDYLSPADFDGIEVILETWLYIWVDDQSALLCYSNINEEIV